MIAKALYVDTDLLEEKLDSTVYKIEYIVNTLGISRQAFDKKRKGITPFRASEVFVLCSLLNLTDEEKVLIFKPKS